MSGRDSFLVERPRDLGEAAAARVSKADTIDDWLRQGRRSTGRTTPAGGPRWLDVLAQESV
jgi:hypothetical protein